MGLFVELIKALFGLSDNRTTAIGRNYELSGVPESDDLGWIDEFEMLDALIEDEE